MGCQLRMTEAVRWAHWRATGSPARRREHDNGALTEKTVRVMLRAVAAASQKNEAQETTTTRKRADNEV
jgi:hypothetical protein